MCEQHGHVDRRAFLRGIAAAGTGLLAFRGGVARAAVPGGVADPLDLYRRTASRLEGASVGSAGPVHVFVLVVDGLRTDEVTPYLMPRLSALRDAGTTYLNAQAVHVAETLPNHVAMMTGVRAHRNGVPGNNIFDRAEGVRREMDRPEDITAETLFTTLKANDPDLVTACVQSKEYLYQIFRGAADHEWHPAPQIPVSDHAPDNFAMDVTLDILEAYQPRFMFINLGDCDRSGHADVSGATTVPAFRTAVLAHTDVQIGRFVDALISAGLWDSSVVIMSPDHSMDWSLPHKFVSLHAAFGQDDDVAGTYEVGQNGGADLIYYTGDPDKREFVLDRMRSIALAQEGVLSVHDPAEFALGERAGDLIVFVKPGWRFTDPDMHSNPIPGNHGHPATVPIPFVVGGGSSLVRQTFVQDRIVRNIDVAPTVAWLFGADAPAEGYEGTVLSDAFTGQPAAV